MRAFLNIEAPNRSLTKKVNLKPLNHHPLPSKNKLLYLQNNHTLHLEKQLFLGFQFKMKMKILVLLKLPRQTREMSQKSQTASSN